jgi:two-component system chemotaxis response regulator CheY
MSGESPPDILPRIMVVNDAGLVRRYYRDILEAAGFAVDEALNGLEALEKLLLRPVDLLIVDINMPKMDGLTFIRTLRAGAPGIAAIPALVISTEAAEPDIAAARAAGANLHRVKPIAPERLLRYVTLLCGPPATPSCAAPLTPPLCAPPLQ